MAASYATNTAKGPGRPTRQSMKTVCYSGTPREHWGLHVDEWPEAPHGSEQDILDLNNKMRVRLAEEAF